VRKRKEMKGWAKKDVRKEGREGPVFNREREREI